MSALNFERDLTEKGAMYVWATIRSFKSFRDYYRAYPYDDCGHNAELDQHLDDYYDENAIDPYQEVQDKCNELMATLTPHEQQVARMLMSGDKPRHIAETLGYENSGAIRFVKHSIKRKLLKQRELLAGRITV